ncbi:hypothetical protein LTR08_000759 [Meristemomyces frigidus]|nr:hypothetical protein LTR08_000759 [Meristemomyces frigidus]
MAPSRKRKHVATENQQTMAAFAGVSKKDVAVAGKDDGVQKRRKLVDQVTEKENEAATKRAKASGPKAAKVEDATTTTVRVEKKRKRRSADTIVESSDDEANARPSIFKQFAKKPTPSSPRPKRLKPALPPSPAETPSKKAAALFSDLHLSKAIPFALPAKRREGVTTPPPTPSASDLTPPETPPPPPPLQDLLALHSAFLDALALHYAHNGGPASPVNAAALLPQITKTWNKRAVTLADLRRILSPLLHPTPTEPDQGAAFALQDFGPRAGVRVVSLCAPDEGASRGRALKRAASSGYIDREALCASFEEALARLWEGGKDADAAAFLAELPLAALPLHASAAGTSPALARGAQRLAELKLAALQQQEQQQRQATPSSLTTTTTTNTANTPPLTAQPRLAPPQTRTSTLLTRILARLPPPLNRRNRRPPQKTTLTTNPNNNPTTTTNPTNTNPTNPTTRTTTRTTLPLPTLHLHLQQSLRTPITLAEVELCMRLLAEEITPGFVRVVELGGGVKGVVLCAAGAVGVEGVRGRVGEALGRG